MDASMERLFGLQIVGHLLNQRPSKASFSTSDSVKRPLFWAREWGWKHYETHKLYGILKGDISFVGPRPTLYNQDGLVELRTEKGIHRLIPGITGWAQVNGRDELPIPVKVEFDEYYLKNRSFLLELKILLMTFRKVVRREGVKH